MGLFDNIKSLKDVAASVVSTASSLTSQEQTNAKSPEPQLPDKTIVNGKVTINTLDGMSSWLQELQTSQTSPSAMQALQSQMQVLNFVKSPTLTGMAVDTMIMCLYKAIQSSTSEAERDAVRESFALMIQSFMFFNEAQLQYEINSNKEEGIQLLSQAGEILSKSVVSVATLVATGGAAAPQVANVVVGNVFGQQNGQQSFFGKLISFIGNEKRIEEKKAQHNDSLKNAFAMFDRYSDMIGRSIVLHGMLERYGRQLIENFEEQKTKYVLVDISSNSAVDNFFDNIFSNGEKKEKLTGYDYVVSLRNDALEKLNDCERNLANKKNDLVRKQKEYDNMSAIRFQAKKELKAEIDHSEFVVRNAEDEVASAKKELAKAESAVEKMKQIKPEIDAYAAKINATVDKFAFDFSNTSSGNTMPLPPVPTQIKYNISVNGQSSGPYSIDQLQDMASQGSLSRDTFVWTKGMAGWEKAANVQELSQIFDSVPPPPPML